MAALDCDRERGESAAASQDTAATARGLTVDGLGVGAVVGSRGVGALAGAGDAGGGLRVRKGRRGELQIADRKRRHVVLGGDTHAEGVGEHVE